MWKRLRKTIKRSIGKVFPARQSDRQLQELHYGLENLPYEIYEKIKNHELTLELPIIKNAEETIQKILQDKCSLARFGDGEFSLMRGGRIRFQNPSPRLAQQLKAVLASEFQNLLIGLPECFGTLEHFAPHAAEFWRKWMAKKRTSIYACLDMDRIYYSAFFTRVYMPYVKTETHYQRCGAYFTQIKKIWEGRDVVICEGEGTRFGMFNDLLEGSKSIRRILCPACGAFDKYDAILSAFDGIDKDVLVLAALGPTATVLAYDLCQKGFQTLDIGHLDVEYEWFLRKNENGGPLPFKYVDGSDEGRKVHKLENSEYESQVIKKIV